MEPDKSRTHPRIRKSLAAMRFKDQKTGKLESTDERKAYFYCLKLLGVLPPPPLSGFKDWKYYSRANRQLYTPKCLHDVLIASHATACEHQTIYFGSYHRHLMVLTEIFLNFAHQVLLGGYDKLQTIYFPQYSPQKPPKQQDKYFTNEFKFLYNKENKDLWTNVFKFYQKLKDIHKIQIANHYWNPTNYLNDQDLTVLKELAPKYTSDDKMDILFKDINRSYPWQINVRRRMYDEQKQYHFNHIDNPRFFWKQQVKLNKAHQQFKEKNCNPRQQDSVSFYGINMEFFADDNNLQTDVWRKTISRLVRKRNFTSYSQEKYNNYSLNSVENNELLLNYRAKSKNLQYITKKEGNENHLPSGYPHNYNMLTPHWQYANALFNSSIGQFYKPGKKGVQLSHNTMHDNFNTILNDPTYSITSLMFFPYHSWIDCGIQLYIRRANNDKSQTTPFSSLSKLLDLENPQPKSFIDAIKKAKTKNITDYQLKWEINGVILEQGKAEAYPICEYMNPGVKYNTTLIFQNLKVLEASFCAGHYILTDKNIRNSLQLNEIYQNYYIKELHTNRFKFLNDIKKYNFDYDYQVQAERNTWEKLDIYAKNLPKYLKDMSNQWKEENQTRNKAILRSAQVSFNPTVFKQQVQKIQTGNTFEGQEKGALQQFSLISGKKQEPHPQPVTEVPVEQIKKIRKLFQYGLHLYASYPPDAKNGNYLIFLDLSNAIKQFNQYYRLKQQKGNKYSKKLVDFIQIFGKESFADICPKCQNNKACFLDLDENLRVRHPELWQFIHTKALNPVLYDSNNSKIVIKCVSENISLVANHSGPFKDYRLVYGAEEIEVSIIDKTDKNKNESQYIRLDAESYSVSKDVINSVLSKKFYTFKSKRFTFYKIFDVFNENENDYFDRYVYKRLKGVIFVGSKKIEFNIPIPCYQRLLRLKLYIIGNSENLQVVVEDADFLAKTEFYRSAAQI